MKRFDQHVRQTISFRESMGRIVERDAIVRQHLEVVAEGPEAITYRIIGVAVPTAQTSMAGATIPATARGGGAT